MWMTHHGPGLTLCSSLIMLSSAATLAQQQPADAVQDALLAQSALVGTWTEVPQGPLVEPPPHPAQGVYHVRFHHDGRIEVLDHLAMASPSWIVTSPDGRFAWMTNEEKAGQVTSVARDAAGHLRVINTVSSEGAQPTHAALTPDAKFLLVANYAVEKGGAGITLLPVNAQGALAPAAQQISYDAGSGVVKQRQDSAHAHSVTFTPDGRYVYVADLGADRIHAYRYHAEKPQPLEAAPAYDIKMAAGSGPRHMLFSPDGKFAWVTAEMSGEVVTFTVNEDRLTAAGKVSLTENPDPAYRSAAGIILSPDHQFIITANRGRDNKLLVYRIQHDGSLALAGRYDCGGVEPRAFTFDPSGRYLLVANVYSNNVAVFHYDAATGALQPAAPGASIPTPTDVTFFSR